MEEGVVVLHHLLLLVAAVVVAAAEATVSTSAITITSFHFVVPTKGKVVKNILILKDDEGAEGNG